jgi:hypothetical protein
MKALGIIAMIFAIVSIFVPVIGPYLTIVCALLAAFAGGAGLTYGAVAIGVNILNVAFLSPSLWILAGAAEAETQGSGSNVILGMGVIFIGIQVVAALVLIIVHSIWKKNHISVEVKA